MHRRIARPYGHSIPATRLFSLVLSLVVLWMLYERMRDPATWKWLAEADEQPAVAPAPAAAPPEPVVPGPNDLDPATLAEFRNKLELVSDRAELRPREMPLYWELMQWSRTEPFQQLEHRAAAEPPFKDFFEVPNKRRGKPIRLRMHVTRVLDYEAPENPLDIKQSYEAWGWTDESKSFPYVVVFPELPPGMPVGKDAHAEVVFVGYFLKVMSYTAFDARRGAPLLVGRVRLAAPRTAPKPVASDPLTLVLLAAIGAIMAAAAFGWWALNARRKPPVTPLPADLSELGPLIGTPLSEPATIGLPSRADASATDPPRAATNVFADLHLDGTRDLP